MWNFFWHRRQRFRFTVIAPQTRGQEETLLLRDNIEDLGAAAALHQVIEASRPRRDRMLSSQTVSLHVRTNVSAVSADSEDFVRNPYADAGRRPPRQEGGSSSSPLAVAHPAETENSIEDDYFDVDRPDGCEAGEEPQGIRMNLLMDPVGTLLHLGAAATLTAGPPGRQYITSGPPAPDQRGRRDRRSNSQVRPLPTPNVPLPPVLTQRPRAASNPVLGGRPRISAHTRSVSTS